MVPDDQRDGFLFLGNRLWLDLLNTTPCLQGKQEDLLSPAGAAIRWTRAAGLSCDDPGHSDLVALREILRPMVPLMQSGQSPPVAAVDAANRLLDSFAVRYRFDGHSAKPRLTASTDATPAAQVAHDFAAFACDFEPDRLKRCGNHACNLVFYDNGKSSRRKWCSMAACGNRDKVNRYRSTRKDESERR